MNIGDIMGSIKEKLFKLQDKEYRKIQVKTITNIDPDTIIGVRTPELKKLANEMFKSGNYKSFIEDLPHKYFDENQLHAFIISKIKNYDECLDAFKKNSDKLIKEIKVWIKSKKTYTIRFGISMLMRNYLDDNYKEEYLGLVSKIRSKEYYVNMMIAWFFATALAKRYDDTIKYIENEKLDRWTHNKTIQKAIESYRITIEQKEYLRSLKKK